MLKRWKLVVWVVLSALLWHLPVLCRAEETQNPSYQEVLKKDGVTKIVLANGLSVVFSENHAAPVVAFQMWVNVGSRNETDEQAGISHVFEHMLFKGTKKRGVGEIAKEIEAAGGNINAYTSFDQTVYHLALASRYFDVGLDVMADAIQHSAFDPQELAKEEEVILEELKRSEDMPGRMVSQKLFETAYRVHPYRRPVIGYRETFKHLTRQQIIDYFHAWYVPNNMSLIVVGDFRIDEAIPKVQAAFQGFAPNPALALTVPQEPEQKRTAVVITRKPSSHLFLDVGFHIPGVRASEAPALDLLAQILGGGKTSRLYQSVKRKRQLVHAISAYSYTPKDPGLFLAKANLDGKDLEETLHEVLRQIERLKVEPVSAEEMNRAQVGIESDFVYGKETMEGQASQFGSFEADFGDPLYQNTYLQRIASVTPREEMAVARKYLRPENMTVSLLLDPNRRNDLDEGKVKHLLKGLSRKVAKEFQSAKRREEGQPQKITLQNGIRLIVEEDHAVPTLSVQIAFMGGQRFETDETSGIYNFIASMLDRGTNKRSAEEIAMEIEDMAGSVNGFSGRNSIGASLSVLSKHFERGMYLLADVVLNPSFDPVEMEKVRKDILASIKQQQDQLSRRAGNLFRRTLYKTHPYRMRLIGEEATVSRFTRDDLKKSYANVLSPDKMVIAVVGDVSTEETVQLVKKLFGKMTRKMLPLPNIVPEIHQDRIRESVEMVNREQAHMILGFLGTTVTSKDRYPLQVLSNILSGQGGRLFTDLRDKKSLAYVVTSFSREGLDPGYFAAYIGCSPEKLRAAREGILAELRRVREKRVPEKEMDRSRRNLIGTFEIHLQTNGARASTMLFDELYGNGFDAYRDYARKIQAVTARDVQRVARKYLDLSKYSVAIVRPGE